MCLLCPAGDLRIILEVGGGLTTNTRIIINFTNKTEVSFLGCLVMWQRFAVWGEDV